MKNIAEKISKSKEIGSFYLDRYLDIRKVPGRNAEFLATLKRNSNPVRNLLVNVDRADIIRSADRICSGQLKIMTLPSELFSRDLDWHKDYYSGHIFPLKPFNRIYDPNDSGFDLNVPFELSRFYFAPTLAQAFQFTGDSKYLEKFLELLDSWIIENPYCFGVNWWSPMEVALRAINIITALLLVHDSIDQKKLASYLRLIWKHALYINKYDVVLGNVRKKNNHYLVSMAALFIISLFFTGSRAERFRDIALSGLKREIPRQFLEDGTNFESATGYHQYSTEILLIVVLFGRAFWGEDGFELFFREKLGRDSEVKLRAALDFVSDYARCFGQCPRIGDSSDFRIVVFDTYFDRKPTDHTFLFRLGKYAINYEATFPGNRSAKLYPAGGYGFFKEDRYSLAAFAGPMGSEGTGGHGHNDKCSFVLRVGAQAVFVDSGTYIYNSELQNRYELKQSRAHNIVMIDGKEQCGISEGRVFGFIGSIESKIIMNPQEEITTFAMEHNGYCGLDGLGKVRRELRCMGDRVELRDSIDGKGAHRVEMFFNLHPSVSVETDGCEMNATAGKTKVRVRFPDNFGLFPERSIYSEQYRERCSSRRVVAMADMELPASWTTMIEVSAV